MQRLRPDVIPSRQRKPQKWRGYQTPIQDEQRGKSTCIMSEDQGSGPRKRSALILYGSETGNAQEVAEELGSLAERLHFMTQVSEMNHVKPVRSPQPHL